MTQSAHTPGPWVYEYNPYRSQDDREIPAFQVHGEHKVCEINEDRPLEEQEANVRLIAAVPDLLEALRVVATGARSRRENGMSGIASIAHTAITKKSLWRQCRCRRHSAPTEVGPPCTFLFVSPSAFD